MTIYESDAMQQEDKIIKAAAGWPVMCYGINLNGDSPVIVYAWKKRGKIMWRPVESGEAGFSTIIPDNAVCSVCLSARNSLTRRLEAPFTARRKAKKILPTLLDIQLPFSIETCAYDFLDYKKKPDGTMDILAVAATNENIAGKINEAQKYGIDPEIIDVEGLAVWSQILRETELNDSIKVVVVLEGQSSSLTIGRGSDFVNSYGLNAADVSRALRLLKAYASDAKNIVWYFAGSMVNDENIISLWKSKLMESGYTNIKIINQPELFIARALAIRPLANDRMFNNMRRGGNLHPKIKKHNDVNKIRLSAFLFITGLIILAGAVVLRNQAEQKKVSLSKTASTLVDSLAGYHVAARGSNAVTVVENSIAKQKSELRPFLFAFAPSLLETISKISAIADKNNISIEEISLEYNKCSINGLASDYNGINKIAALLRENGFDVNNNYGNSTADGGITFQITAGRQ